MLCYGSSICPITLCQLKIKIDFYSCCKASEEMSFCEPPEPGRPLLGLTSKGSFPSAQHASATPKTPGNQTPLEFHPLGLRNYPGLLRGPQGKGAPPLLKAQPWALPPAAAPLLSLPCSSLSFTSAFSHSFPQLLPRKRHPKNTGNLEGQPRTKGVKYQLQVRLDPGAPLLIPWGSLLIPPALPSGPAAKTGSQGYFSFHPPGIPEASVARGNTPAPRLLETGTDQVPGLDSSTSHTGCPSPSAPGKPPSPSASVPLLRNKSTVRLRPMLTRRSPK